MQKLPELDRTGELHVFYGFAAQPLVAAFAAFVMFPAIDYTGRSLYRGTAIDPLHAAVSVATSAGIAALFVTVFAALPMFGFLLKRRPLTRDLVLATGAVLGNLPSVLAVSALVFDEWHRGRPVDLEHLVYGPLGLVRALVLGTAIGLACAAFFWQMAGRDIAARA